MRNEIKDLVDDINFYITKSLTSDIFPYMEEKLLLLEQSFKIRNALSRTLKKVFYKPHPIPHPDYGILTAVNRQSFPAFQILYYSVVLRNSLPVTFIDLGISDKQSTWCQRQKINNIPIEKIKDQLICPVGNPEWQTWNQPIYLLNSPYNLTLWLDTNCIVFHDLNKVFDIIKNNIFVVEEGGSDEISEFHVRMGTNLVPHQSGPPVVNSGVLGVNVERDRSLINLWSQGVHKVCLGQEYCPRKEHTCLQWAVEMDNKIEHVICDYQWNNTQYNKKDSKNVIDMLTQLHAVCYIANTGSNPYKWKEEIPIDLLPEELPYVFEIEDFSKKCTIFIPNINMDKPYFKTILLSESSLEDYEIYLQPELRQFGTEYVGIFPPNLKERYPKVQFTLDNIETLFPQLNPNKILGIDIAPPHWANKTERRFRGILEFLQELADEFNMSLDTGPSIGGNAFVCHHTIFQELLDFWDKAYNYLLTKYEFNFEKIPPIIMASQIPMLFFSNSNKQVEPILDRFIKTDLDDDLQHHVCRFDGMIEAKFLDLIQARNYCEFKQYRFA